MTPESQQQIAWRLGHILDAIDEIDDYLNGVGKQEFDASPVLRSAVRCKIQDIGEAANKILEADAASGKAFAKQHPQMPLRQAAGMRHKMIHGYTAVNWDLVWDTARNQLPLLRQQAQQARSKLDQTLPPTEP